MFKSKNLEELETLGKELRRELKDVIAGCKTALQKSREGHSPIELPSLIYARTVQTEITYRIDAAKAEGYTDFDIVRALESELK